MSNPKVHEVDAKNTLCPVPIMRLAAAVKTAGVGDVVRVTATDFGFSPDVKAWCKGTRHELVRLEEQGGVITAEVRKTK